MQDSGATPPRDPLQHDPKASAQRISTVITDPLPPGALRENVEGRAVTGPGDGFGKLWRKHYWIRLDGAPVTPAALAEYWRDHYTEFWPKGSHLYHPGGGLQEGTTAPADLAMIAGVRIGTGIIVMDVSETSFTLNSLQGHTFCGTITFSGSEDRGATVAEIATVLRASDPLYEIGMALGGHRYENRFWKASLTALARSFGVDAPPGMTMECLDGGRKWRNATNVVHNALLHTVAYLVNRSFRRLGNGLRPGGTPA